METKETLVKPPRARIPERAVNVNEVKALRLGLASPQRIQNDWSYGQVEKSETVNYRTFKPEKGGLFCEKIFGPVKDYECGCGRYKSRIFEGVVCDRCGVEVVSSRERRRRAGHIDLAVPVAHIWYYRMNPCRIAIMLGITSIELRSILFYEKYIVIDPGDTDLKELDILNEDAYYKLLDDYPDGNYKVGNGAAAIREILSKINLEKDIAYLTEKIEERKRKNKEPYIKDTRRLEALNDFYVSDNKPEWMILQVLPVIPPELRPMVQLEKGRFATSDLNDIYRRIINRNNRLKKLKQRSAPDVILRNEKRMLQEAVDTLLDNKHNQRVANRSSSTKVLRSLSDLFKGKQGRFRQNLLGKRVDYSGRSVIVVGPQLKLYQCGVPKEMALELFSPFLIHEIKKRGYAMHVKEAKRLIDNKDYRVWDILDELVKHRPVLLNRAPTLHRLGMQAFEPVLVEGKAIQLHPMVCKGYNADFDGDQMAIHVPLSIEAQLESWLLMLASKNLLDPANGNPIVTPSQDMLLGIYILTKKRDNALGANKAFSSVDEAKKAYEMGYLSLHAPIHLYLENKQSGKIEHRETTLGRALFNEVLPPEIDYVEYVVGSKQIEHILSRMIYLCGNKVTVECLDRIKDLGYTYSTKYGISIGVEDIIIPEEKYGIISQADIEVDKVEKLYQKGMVSQEERHNRLVEKWTDVNNKIKDIMFEQLQKDRDGFNPIYMMSDSGARGSKEQIRQLAGMRGLMAKPGGEIIDIPIKSNFKEGLTVLEYFNSTHGARKGLADTALKTADAGYLTRKLVDVAQNIVITEKDCGTKQGVEVRAIRRLGSEDLIESLYERILGHYATEEVKHPRTGEVLVRVGQEITEDIAERIQSIGIVSVKIRNVLSCEAEKGLCSFCYGRNLATGKTVEIGEAVGIAAAQSIGQPGTQLTMRTFHIGGVASTQGRSGKYSLDIPVMVNKLPDSITKTREGEDRVTRNGQMTLQGIIFSFAKENVDKWYFKSGDEIYNEDILGVDKSGADILAGKTGVLLEGDKHYYILGDTFSVDVKAGSVIHVKENMFVSPGEEIFSSDFNADLIVAEISGIVHYQDIIPGDNLTLAKEDAGGEQIHKTIVDHKEESLVPQLLVLNPKNRKQYSYLLPVGCILQVEDGQEVQAGDILGRVTTGQVMVKDITGGLPKVTELFEARRPKNHNFLASRDGVIHLKGKKRGKYILELIYDNAEGQEPAKAKYAIPTTHYLYVRDGEQVKKGQSLCSGEKDPHDILRIMGVEAVATFLLDRVQEVYREQGVRINDKHIGVIIRNMLSKVDIEDPGDSDLIIHNKIGRIELKKKNEQILKAGGAPASGQAVLMGITKAALHIDSFIAAASFQDTTRVLSREAVKSSFDRLQGLKENVILGRMIPAGTGFFSNKAK